MMKMKSVFECAAFVSLFVMATLCLSFPFFLHKYGLKGYFADPSFIAYLGLTMIFSVLINLYSTKRIKQLRENAWQKNEGRAPKAEKVNVIFSDGTKRWNVEPSVIDWASSASNSVDEYMIKE